MKNEYRMQVFGGFRPKRRSQMNLQQRQLTKLQCSILSYITYQVELDNEVVPPILVRNNIPGYTTSTNFWKNKIQRNKSNYIDLGNFCIPKL